jgi:hypothetical protein
VLRISWHTATAYLDRPANLERMISSFYQSAKWYSLRLEYREHSLRLDCPSIKALSSERRTKTLRTTSDKDIFVTREGGPACPLLIGSIS